MWIILGFSIISAGYFGYNIFKNQYESKVQYTLEYLVYSGSLFIVSLIFTALLLAYRGYGFIQL